MSCQNENAATEEQPTSILSVKSSMNPQDSSNLNSSSSGQYSDEKSIDAECERLLRNTKKQVKQMMEEAVTKKFIHEQSSSIISLCVAVDACLTHGLKRRALGLFKTSSSTALIQKLAKTCPSAQEVMDAVCVEEKRRTSSLTSAQQNSSGSGNNQQNETTSTIVNRTNTSSSTKQRPASAHLHTSNSNVHKRNMWIKCALIERKLVSIVEYLAENASKYYEQDALMSNYLCAQLLSSLLVGPSALEFSRGKVYDYYRFEDPTANELIERHKLANPIACLCSALNNNQHNDNHHHHHHSQQQQQQHKHRKQPTNKQQVATDKLGKDTSKPPESEITNESKMLSSTQVNPSLDQVDNIETSATNNLQRNSKENMSRRRNQRRPLALKGGVTMGTLVTDCHHYSCQEISEHQQTRGYSLISAPLIETLNNTSNCLPTGCQYLQQVGGNTLIGSQSVGGQRQVSCEWPSWSPRMLHETLHQNSRSRLLYAKNNVLLETQKAKQKSMPGYLSLHELSSDLVLKWIPNQMINGSGQASCCCSANELLVSIDQPIPEMPLSTSNNPVVEQHQQHQQSQVPVESSYLELVVNLPISRVVLLQCQFNGKSTRFDASSGSEEQILTTTCEHQGHSSGFEQKNRHPYEDTLILVETDGVQRAPFKFPKGGLRLFLSCLENGLQPDRFLEPAIQFHNALESPTLAQTNLHQTATATQSSPPIIMENSGEPHSPTSRLDSLLRRLPSLKRRNQPQTDTAAEVISAATNGEPVNQGVDNFVYRIVSAQQPDWPILSTPPHSALSTSSLPPVSNEAFRSSEQKFRWSLSRLAKFSSRYTKSGSTSTSSSVIAGMASGCEQTTSTQQQTLENPINGTSLSGSSCPLEDQMNTKSVGVDSSRELARIEAKLDYLKKSTSDDVLATLRTQSIQTLCESMRKQIVARAFYGWLAYCRKVRIIRTHLKKLIKSETKLLNEDDDNNNNNDHIENFKSGLTREKWDKLMANTENSNEELSSEVNLLVFYGGVESNDLRKEVWPYLLEHYKFTDGIVERKEKDDLVREIYRSSGLDWISIERVVKQRDKELLTANMAKASRELRKKDEQIQVINSSTSEKKESSASTEQQPGPSSDATTAEADVKLVSSESEPNNDNQELDSIDEVEANKPPSETELELINESKDTLVRDNKDAKQVAKRRRRQKARLESTGSVGSDASITDHFGNNIHRIDKDVQRCDRNFWYFKIPDNLDKLRNIMCTYVWQHLDVGYVQGMCDLAAPFLVIFDDEVLAYTCFCQLMKRLVSNFPHGCAMDQHFESLKHLMQILDPKLFDILQSNGDYTHFYFCYRWLLLDFKRELVYEDVFRVWETIWSARCVATDHFVVFMALAMVRYYRDIIIENNMDFTDTIKFFNEMAERHDTKMILALARDCIVELQNLIET